jgi:hypothetical protein
MNITELKEHSMHTCITPRFFFLCRRLQHGGNTLLANHVFIYEDLLCFFFCVGACSTNTRLEHTHDSMYMKSRSKHTHDSTVKFADIRLEH